MEALLNYLIKSGLCLLALYLFYYVVLRNQPSHTINRLYLLLAPVVAIVLPLLHWSSFISTEAFVAETIQTIQLSEVLVVRYSKATPESTTALAQMLTLPNLLLGLYLLGAAVILVRLATQLLQVRKLVSSGTPLHAGPVDATIIQTAAGYPTFAFLSYVFINEQPHLSPQEKKQILVHELAHVQLFHTWDILYYEVLTALLWFNPVVWLLKNELRDVHEYQADAAVLTQHQPQQYSSLLAKEVLYKTGMPLGSYFREPQVFKRLHMLQQHGRKTNLLRPLLALPLLLALATLFSAKNVSADAGALLPVAQQNPNVSTAAIPHLEQNTPTNLPPATNQDEPVDKVTQKAIIEHPVSDEEEVKENSPYSYVEQMPQFIGGETEMLMFLGKNIRYPKDSQTEGIVVVTFVVSENGSLSNIEVVKGLDEPINQESLRVVGLMQGKWQPGYQNGKPVPVRYALPIRFAMK